MKKKVLSWVVVLLGCWSVSNAGVVYTNGFLNTNAFDTALSNVNWKANVGATAVAYGTNTSGSAPFLSVNDQIFWNPGVVTPVLIWTEAIATTNIVSIGNVTNFQFTLGTQNTNEAVKIAIKVNNAWYVSRTVFNGNGDNALTQTNKLAVQSAAWNTLNFISGSVLSEGTATNMGSGRVQAIGLFDASSTIGNRLRIDNVIVEASPEARLGLYIIR